LIARVKLEVVCVSQWLERWSLTVVEEPWPAQNGFVQHPLHIWFVTSGRLGMPLEFLSTPLAFGAPVWSDPIGISQISFAS